VPEHGAVLPGAPGHGEAELFQLHQLGDVRAAQLLGAPIGQGRGRAGTVRIGTVRMGTGVAGAEPGVLFIGSGHDTLRADRVGGGSNR